MNSQKKYTSTSSKLVFNPDLIENIKKGKFPPTSLHFALTDDCSLNCSFCSNTNRGQNSYTFEEVKNILNVFKMLGAKSVEFTGGEPTLHSNINDIIDYAHSIDFSVGLKSNGIDIKKHVSAENIKKLTWLRVSLNCLDYVEAYKLDFSGISGMTTFGFSYVYSKESEDGILDVLSAFKEKYNAEYIRIIPDNSLSDEEMKALYNSVKGHYIFDKSGVFWQVKDYSLPERCWMMWLKPFINTDKNIYFCCATQMFERTFIPKYRLCSTDTNDIINTWMHPRMYNGKMCEGGKCYFREHNDLIAKIVDGCEHSDFL